MALFKLSLAQTVAPYFDIAGLVTWIHGMVTSILKCTSCWSPLKIHLEIQVGEDCHIQRRKHRVTEKFATLADVF